MSESKPQTATKVKAKAKAEVRKPWRKRRSVRIALVLVAILLILRASLESLLATTVNKIAAEQGLICTWEDLDLGLLLGRAELRLLEVRALTDSGEASDVPLLNLEYAVFDIDVLQLFAGRLSIARAEVDGLDAWWSRDESGRWNIEDHLGTAETLAVLESPEDEREDQVEDEAGESKPIDFHSPISIDALRCQHAHLHFTDDWSDPPIALDLELNVALSHVRDPERAARISASVLGGDLMDALHLTGTADWDDEVLNLALRAQVGAINLQALAPYIEPLGIKPAAATLQAQLLLDAEIRVIGERGDALQISADLHDVRVAADGGESVALDRLLIDVSELSTRGASVAAIEIDGVRGRGILESDYGFTIAGLRFGGGDWVDTVTESPAVEDDAPSTGLPRWLARLQSNGPDTWPWTVERFRLRGGRIDYTDRTVSPAALLPVTIQEIAIGRIAHVPGAVEPIPILVRLSAPGNAERIMLDGAVQPFAPDRSVELALRVEKIELGELAGHLQRAGIGADLQHGNFQVRVSGVAKTVAEGRVEGYLHVDGTLLEDDIPLFGVQKIHADGLLADSTQRLLRIGSLEVSGTQFTVGHDVSHQFFGLGLYTLGMHPDGLEPEEASVDDSQLLPTPTAAKTPLRFELGRLSWTDNSLRYLDLSVDPLREITLEEIGFELDGLTLGGDPAGPPHEPAHFRVWIAAPGIVESAVVDGVIRTQPGPLRLSVDLRLDAQGGRGVLLAALLRDAGLEPIFEAAELQADIYAEIERLETGWEAALDLRDLVWSEGDEVLLALPNLRVDGFRFGEASVEGGPAPLRAKSVVVAGAHLPVSRDADGRLVFGGLRSMRNKSSEVEIATTEEALPTAQIPAIRLPQLPRLQVDHIGIEELHLVWADAGYDPELRSGMRLDLEIDGFNTDGVECDLHTRIHVPESLEELRIDGKFKLASGRLGIGAELRAHGIAAGPLHALLPPNIMLKTEDGELRLRIDAELQPAALGGASAAVDLSELHWGRPGADPWIAIDRARIVVPRADADEGVLIVGPVAIDGVSSTLKRASDGHIQVFGIHFLSLEPEAESAAEPTAEDLESMTVAAPRIPLHHVEFIDDFRIGIDSLKVLSDEWSRPLDAHLNLEVRTPLQLVADDPSTLPAIGWNLEFGIRDAVRSAWVNGEAAPFAPEPRFDIELGADGIDMTGLVALLPGLDAIADGLATDATLRAKCEGTLYVRRARPREIGLSRPFGAEVSVTELALREYPDGPILAGVDQILVDLSRVDLAKNSILIDTLELVTPRAIIERDQDMLRAVGIGFSLSKDAPVEEVESAEDEAPIADTTPATALDPTVEVAAVNGGEFRIDHLIVAGADLTLRDVAGESPVEFKLDTFDAEVKRFTTRIFHEPRAVQFSAFIGTSTPLGDGPAFQELALIGRLRFFPEMRGWTQLSLAGFELASIAPIAAQQGLSIQDGAVEASVQTRFDGDGSARVDASFVFTDLKLEETNGFLEQLFKLPTSLDSALFLLRNSDGEHRFSAGFRIEEDGLGKGAITGAATTAFAEVFARALAAVPFRLLGTIAPPMEPADPISRDWTVRFGAGATEPQANLAADIREASKLLASKKSFVLVLRHELTEADLSRAAVLANPPEETCLEIIRGLRQRKSELHFYREQAHAKVVTGFAIGDPQARAVARELRELDQQLAKVESALDQMFEILRSDSPRQSQKRTRVTARKIAEIRLQSLRSMLEVNLKEKDRVRIEVRPPRSEIAESTGGGWVRLELRER